MAQEARWWMQEGPRPLLTDEAKREIGRRIRAQRLHLGLKTVELARLAGRDDSGLSDVERGKQPPSLAGLLRIADALGVNASTLIPDGDSPNDIQYQRGFRHGFIHALEVLQENVPE